MERLNENSVPSTSNVPAQLQSAVTMPKNISAKQVLTDKTNSAAKDKPYIKKKACLKVIKELIEEAGQKTPSVLPQMLCSIQELIDGKIDLTTLVERSSKEFGIQFRPVHKATLANCISTLRDALVREELSVSGLRPPPMTVPLPKTNMQFLSTRPVTANAAVRPTITTNATFVAPRLIQNVPPASNPNRIFEKSCRSADKPLPKYIIPGAAQLLQQHKGKLEAITSATFEPNMINRIPELAEKPMPLKIAGAGKILKQRTLEDHPMKKDYEAEGIDLFLDTAALASINLGEEYVAGAEDIGAQERSIKELPFLNLSNILARFNQRRNDLGVEKDALVMISQGVEEHLKNIIESLITVVDLRLLDLSINPDYERQDGLKCQIMFLGEAERAQDRIHRELEREELLRIVNTRSRADNPERARIRARAIEIQRAEIANLHQQNANLTALEATGPRKRIANNSESKAIRRSLKRATLRDLLFVLEKDPRYRQSMILYSAYLR